MIRRLRIALLITLTGLLSGCATVFFHPLERSHSATPAQIGLPYEDVYFSATDGVRLHGWFMPAFGEAQATVVFLHGNTDDIGAHFFNIGWLPAAGYNVFMFDYRGYGKSAGKPSFAGVFDDIESAFATVVKRPDIDPQRLIVYGQSQGGAMAVYAVTRSAYRSHMRALIIESAFSSYRMIAREALSEFFLTWPFRWPLSFSVSDTYSPMRAIANVSPMPILIIHSEEDRVIPPHHATLLYAAAKHPKKLWLSPRGGHIRTLNNPELRQGWLHFTANALDLPQMTASTALTRPIN